MCCNQGGRASVNLFLTTAHGRCQQKLILSGNPKFDDIEEEFEGERFKDPGPGMARQGTEFVLSPFYTRSHEDRMEQPTAQQELLAGNLQPIPAEGPRQGPPGPAGGRPWLWLISHTDIAGSIAAKALWVGTSADYHKSSCRQGGQP